MVTRFLVHGRVQGVGFRWFVAREAGRLSLQGYVQNLPDGTVEVWASGDEAALRQLEQALGRGPSAARVDRVEKAEVSHEIKLPKPFDIR